MRSGRVVWFNLTVRFVVELLAVGFVGYWGFNASNDTLVRLALGIGAAVAFAVVWGLFLAPTSRRGLTTPQKNVLGTILLLVAAGALAIAGQPAVAAIYAVVVILNAAALLVLGDRVTSSLDRFGRPG
jgi:hypothetical protein